jgi:two-component system, chemotaxis family, protein-glutamate methylesterase/glutaminase
VKPNGRLRVLVIDDSAYSRQAITRMLASSPLVEVVGVARDGEDALRKLFQLEPDLITLDLEMPRMDGFTFLRIVMSKRPTPVLVISGRSEADAVFKALELGAVDFIGKPTPHAAPELGTIEQELIRKVHAIRELRIDRVGARLAAMPNLMGYEDLHALPKVVVIGSSTGGPAALMQLFASFSQPPACGFVVAQHMPEGFTRGFADRLDRLTPLRAFEAQGGETPIPGVILVAPGGRHLVLEVQRGQIQTRVVARGPADKYAPSVDRLFESAAKHYGGDLVALVLTGMGDDGRRGVQCVKRSGGTVIAESEETAVIFGMPQQAIRTGMVDRVLPLGDIAASIQNGVACKGTTESSSMGRGSYAQASVRRGQQ